MLRLHIQLTPQIHEGELQYYWHVDLHNKEGVFTIKHGWAKTKNQAFVDAEKFCVYGANGV